MKLLINNKLVETSKEDDADIKIYISKEKYCSNVDKDSIYNLEEINGRYGFICIQSAYTDNCTLGRLLNGYYFSKGEAILNALKYHYKVTINGESFF